MDVTPWTIELIVVRKGATGVAEQRALARDVERGLLLRLRRGVVVEREGFLSLSEQDQYLVRLRAFAAVAAVPPVFSHFSAAMLHGLPLLWPVPLRVHTTVEDVRQRGQDGVSAHLGPLPPSQVTEVQGLLVTTVARTVVDVARCRPLVEGVVIADGALHAGLHRWLLDEAVDLAGGMRGAGRAEDAAAFARAEAESAAESISRFSMMRAGIAPPVLQHVVRDERGFAGKLDFFFPLENAGGEVDGDRKYLDPRIAKEGAAQALVAERHREIRVLASLDRLARWGYAVAHDPLRLGAILAKAKVLPPRVRVTFEDYCGPNRRRKRRPDAA